MSRYELNPEIGLAGHVIGRGRPVYIVAEMSANHLQDYDRALRILHAAKEAGADAVKLQTYTADTITIDSEKEYFRLKRGTIWDGMNLHSLYREAFTPWDWQPKLCEEAKKLGLDCFSSPFDPTAVEFMEEMGMPAYKIASYEITDIPLIRLCASKGKPVILATGIALEEEIRAAIEACLQEGNRNVILLKCVSAYPTPYEDVNLNTIPYLAEEYGVVCGLSDHTFGHAVALGAVSLGACMIEKHLTLARADGGPDGSFSMEPAEFAEMVKNVRILEKALGERSYKLTDKQVTEREGRRSLFVVADIRKGESFTPENIRSIRPGYGLPPAEYEELLGRHAARDLERGEPLKREDLA
ncbi:MAG: pseudaminic acid synthase [Lachnospiraceae bacterium]|nr:pseudaminic acid synthase [Lachnospiraceae bacterium]